MRKSFEILELKSFSEAYDRTGKDQSQHLRNQINDGVFCVVENILFCESSPLIGGCETFCCEYSRLIRDLSVLQVLCGGEF